MERDSVNFPFPQIHRAVGTTPFSSRRRQADGLCRANHGSIGDFRLPLFLVVRGGIGFLERLGARSTRLTGFWILTLEPERLGN